MFSAEEYSPSYRSIAPGTPVSDASITGGHMIYVLYVLIRTHDGPKNHVFPYVYTPYFVLIINTIVRVLPYPYYGGAYDVCNICTSQNPRWTQKPCIPLCLHDILGSDYYIPPGNINLLLYDRSELLTFIWGRVPSELSEEPEILPIYS